MSETTPSQCVAIIGGATAGAEVAHRLAERGLLVAVFEQNARPYGKIEDGLPRWHVGLRKKEYDAIAGKLASPLIRYVPNTRIGTDVDFGELVEDWGFASVVLANGAWRDRPLPVDGADEYVGRGLVYQNPFVIAFNHMDDPNYRGERFEILDDSIVVGGGMASIDVAKIHTLHCTRQALQERGIDVSIVDLEVKGIPKTLEAHGLSWEELGLSGCTIYYRRRIEDMPLVTVPPDATPERIAKLEKSRRTLIDKASDKYKLRVVELSAPDGLLVEDDRLVGLRFRRTRVEGGKVLMTDETFEVRGAAIVSSIGSIPEPIPGIDMKGELFDFVDWTYGRLAGFPTVFSAGNVVTGKGNIVASRKHATQVSHDAVEIFLGVADEDARREALPALERAGAVAAGVADHAESLSPLTAEELSAIEARIESRQRAVGYTGDIGSWLAKVGEPC